VYHEVEVAMN